MTDLLKSIPIAFEDEVQKARNNGLSSYQILKAVRRVIGISNWDHEVSRINREKLQVDDREKQKRFPKSTYQMLYDKQNGKCGICNKPLFIPAKHRENEIDHINVNLEGDTYNQFSNLQLTHGKCNREKSAKDLFQVSKETGKTIPEIIE